MDATGTALQARSPRGAQLLGGWRLGSKVGDAGRDRLSLVKLHVRELCLNEEVHARTTTFQTDCALHNII